jgi:hypothetical protein
LVSHIERNPTVPIRAGLRMIGGGARGLMFLSSYLPEFLIFTLLTWGPYGYWALAPLVAGIAGIGGILIVLWWVGSTAPITVSVARVHRKDAEALAYLVTYVLPFLSLDLSEPTRAISFVILFSTLAIVYINADMLNINPTLNLLGWHVFELETPEGHSHSVITRRRRLLPGDRLSVITIADGIQWEGSGRRRKASSASL